MELLVRTISNNKLIQATPTNKFQHRCPDTRYSLILVRLFTMADPAGMEGPSSRTVSLLYNRAERGGGVMRVMLVTASLTVTRDAMIHLLALLQCNQARPEYGMIPSHWAVVSCVMLPSGAGYCSSSTEQQYSGGGGVVTLQCMIAAERLLAATLVYMMLILAGDIETNPGPTLCESLWSVYKLLT